MPHCRKCAGESDAHFHHVNCRNQPAAGTLCSLHFNRVRGTNLTQGEVDDCPDCKDAKRRAAERIQRHHTIDPAQPYGQHIALRCVNHPELRWHTKNIDYIGARSVFYPPLAPPECECPLSDLEPVPLGE